MDALVAEQVMGCRVQWRTYGSKGRYPYCDCHGNAGFHNQDDEQNDDMLKAYSTDIAAAWQVVEKLAEQGIKTSISTFLNPVVFNVVLVGVPYNPLTAQSIGMWRDDCWATRKNVAEAICLAALNAVGYNHTGANGATVTTSS